MASNLYHLLAFIPATEAWEMPPALEALAQRLVRSGKLRINADTERNFVRHGTSDTDQTFTARELTDPALAPATRALLARHVAPALGQAGIQDIWALMMHELKKTRGVSVEKEMKVARVLVQSAHPSVIELLLMGGTQVFVSYSHNVGDLMAVRDWATTGTANGLQSTDTGGTGVYVSAAGDPFFEGEHKTYLTDGFPALARMVVIAGQELGHFADLRRSAHGIVGRHSTDTSHMQLRASPIAREARLADVASVNQLKLLCQQYGLPRLLKTERDLAFYDTHGRYSPPWFFHQLRRLVAWSLFTRRCRTGGIHQRLRTYPALRHGAAMEQYLADMAFNLAPDAESYRDPDPLVEEAITVIEAVARVPQQVHKWGHTGVRKAWPGLYRFYYQTIIPAAQAAVGRPSAVTTIPPYQQLKAKLRRLMRPRPGYYPASPSHQRNAK